MKIAGGPGLAALLALAALAGAPAQARAAEPTAAAAPGAGGGYLGVRGEPGSYGNGRALTVTEVAAGSPAEAAGIQPGDTLLYLFWKQGTLAAWLKPPQVHATDQAAVDAWLDTHPPDREIHIQGVRNRRAYIKAVRLGTPPGGALGRKVGATPGAGDLGAIEAARSAYLQMCGKGAEKLGPATCDSLRRDLDAAVAAQAAAAREAEVMAVHRRLCGPGARQLSAETCAAMLAEAKRTLAAEAAAPTAAAPTAAAPTRAAAKAAPKTPTSGGAKAELKSAYDELCAPGAQQVSAETCAALKADAAPNPRTR